MDKDKRKSFEDLQRRASKRKENLGFTSKSNPVIENKNFKLLEKEVYQTMFRSE